MIRFPFINPVTKRFNMQKKKQSAPEKNNIKNKQSNVNDEEKTQEDSKHINRFV